MKISSLSAIILATLTGRVAAGNFLFMNYQGWYENFDSYDKWHRSLWTPTWTPPSDGSDSNAGAGGATTGAGGSKEKKSKEKGGKDKGPAQSKSAPGSIDPFASFDCKEDKSFKVLRCDVVLVASNNKHCDETHPTALAKGSFTEWQWDKSIGVSNVISFDIECCGANGCEPATMTDSTGNYVIQQLPDGKNKIVPGLRVYGPVADDKEPVADGEQTVIVRMGGGLK